MPSGDITILCHDFCVRVICSQPSECHIAEVKKRSSDYRRSSCVGSPIQLADVDDSSFLACHLMRELRRSQLVHFISRCHNFSSCDRGFGVGAEDGAEGVADFAERGVGFHGVVDVGHQVFSACGGFAQRGEAAVDFVIASARRAAFAAASVCWRAHRFVDLQNFDGLFFARRIRSRRR